jgi:hypothetical protein
MLSEFNVHPLRTAIINSITLAVAVGLASNRRSYPQLAPAEWKAGTPAQYVEIIVPARNEERNIGRVLTSLVRQRYPDEQWGITVVDDHSEDRTFQIAMRYSEAHPVVSVVAARALPPGWTGKNNAMYSGYLAARPDARYLLFVDADTEFHDQMLSTVVLTAEARGAALLSLVLDLDLATFSQRLLAPQVGELYTLLAGTMDAVNRGGGKAAANGQCMLVGYEAYARHGALPEVKGDVAEDRALAAALKSRGEVIRLEHGERLGRVRAYPTFREAWAGYSKTLYWAAGRSSARTAAIVLALELYSHLPIWSLLRAVLDRRYPHRRSALLHAPLQLLPMLLLRVAVCRLMRVPTYYALAYPVAVAVGNAMLLYSWLRSRSAGVSWKGRRYTVQAGHLYT